MLPSGPKATVPGRPLAPAKRSRTSWGWMASPFTKCTGCCGSIRICFKLRQLAGFMRGLQFSAKALVFRFVERDVSVVEDRLFRAGQLSRHKIGDVWQPEFLV